MFDFLYFNLSQIFSWEFVSHGWPQFVAVWNGACAILIWLTEILWSIYSGLSGWILSSSGWALHGMWYATDGLFAVPLVGLCLTLFLSFVIFIIAAATLLILLILFLGFLGLIWIVGGSCILALWLMAWFIWYVCWTLIVWMATPFWNLFVWCLIIAIDIAFFLALITIVFIFPGAAAGQVLYYLDDYETRWRYGLSLIGWMLFAGTLTFIAFVSHHPLICIWYFILALAVHVGFRYKKLPLTDSVTKN